MIRYRGAEGEVLELSTEKGIESLNLSKSLLALFDTDGFFHVETIGLPNIYVKGWVVFSYDGTGYSIPELQDLHKEVAIKILESNGRITPKEFKFLRRELRLTQTELGRYLDVSDQTIARWEKGMVSIPSGMGKLLKSLYTLDVYPSKTFGSLKGMLKDNIDVREHKKWQLDKKYSTATLMGTRVA